MLTCHSLQHRSATTAIQICCSRHCPEWTRWPSQDRYIRMHFTECRGERIWWGLELTLFMFRSSLWEVHRSIHRPSDVGHHYQQNMICALPIVVNHCLWPHTTPLFFVRSLRPIYGSDFSFIDTISLLSSIVIPCIILTPNQIHSGIDLFCFTLPPFSESIVLRISSAPSCSPFDLPSTYNSPYPYYTPWPYILVY